REAWSVPTSRPSSYPFVSRPRPVRNASWVRSGFWRGIRRDGGRLRLGRVRHRRLHPLRHLALEAARDPEMLVEDPPHLEDRRRGALGRVAGADDLLRGHPLEVSALVLHDAVVPPRWQPRLLDGDDRVGRDTGRDRA